MASCVGRTHSRRSNGAFGRRQILLVTQAGVRALLEEIPDEVRLSGERSDVEWRVTHRRLVVDIGFALLDQDSRNLNVTNHRGAVEWRHPEIVAGIHVGATFQQSED